MPYDQETISRLDAISARLGELQVRGECGADLDKALADYEDALAAIVEAEIRVSSGVSTSRAKH